MIIIIQDISYMVWHFLLWDLLFYLCSRRNMRGNFILDRCRDYGLHLDDSQITRGKAKVEELINTDPDWKQLIKTLVVK